MLRKKLIAGILTASMVVTMFPSSFQLKASAADDVVEIEIEKTECSNPIGGYDTDGNLIYGGDPAVLVDGDTVYLYTGHDEGLAPNGVDYKITEWLCYSTKDLKNWKLEGSIMSAGQEDISWTSTGYSGWAGQVAKYKNEYYFYYCTWDKTSSGKHSIGVAKSSSPTGPFVDKGEPLVKGTVTEPQTSDWNDIDPTVWIEEDDQGVEHRYLAWGNGKFYVCELEEDMMTVKDLDGDGEITCGTPGSTADIIGTDGSAMGITLFTEAPWLYRRQNAEGKYVGDYYLFYAYGWREEMAYATTDDLMSGKWTFGKVLMPPTATSNTNHMAVFDFQGKTYFVYHNGSLPGGNGNNRNACITELHFNEDGSIQEIPETAVGITGGKTSKIYAKTGGSLSHVNYRNSSSDGDYPYTDVKVGAGISKEEEDAEWAIVAGKADKTKVSYVSIQSENKPGLYLTVNDDKSVVLAQDAVEAQIETTAKKQTFRTVQGLDDVEGVSFESVSQPGLYLTVTLDTLTVTDGSNKAAATFYVNRDVELEQRKNARFEAAKLDEAAVVENTTEYELIVDDSMDNCLVVAVPKADADKTLKISIGDNVLLEKKVSEADILNETLTGAEQADYQQITVPISKDVLAASSQTSTKDEAKKSVTVKFEGDAVIYGTLYTRKAYSSSNSLSKLTVDGQELTVDGDSYMATVPYSQNSVEIVGDITDASGYMEINGAQAQSGVGNTVAISGSETVITVSVVAQDFVTIKNYTLTVKKDYTGIAVGTPVYAFGFEDQTDGAYAVTKAAKPAEVSNASYQYTDGANGGKAIYLDGTYGLRFCVGKQLGDSYTLSFWMKPDQLNGGVDPTLAAGTFSPEYWLNLTFDAKIWSNHGGYIDTPAANAYVAGEWQHVALVVDSSVAGTAAGRVTGKLFVNGRLVSTGDVADGIMTNAGAEVYFGVNAWDAYYKGALDEVLFFNKVLTDDEVGAIAGKAITVSNVGTPTYKPGEEPDDDNNNNDTPAVTKAVKKVVITKKGSSKAVKKLNLKRKKSVKLAAKVTVTGGASKKVKWTTSNKKLATVSAKGVVKAKNKKGTVKITATSTANKKKKCTIKITIK